MMRNLCTVLAIGLAACLTAPTLRAQAVGTILGTIYDSSGSVVPDATVTIANEKTGLKRATASNAAGNYTAPAHNPGRYTLDVERTGFRGHSIKDIELQVDQSARIDITLEPGAVSEAIEVTSESPILNTETPALGQVIDNQRVVNLPLNGRQFLELTLEAPGVVRGNGGPQDGNSTLFSRPGQDSSISVSGGRSQNNSFLIDGTQNTDADVNAYVISPSVDTIQEFKIETKNYSAEFGRSSGGQISVVTKSGTNEFHGSAFEFLRNNAVDARPFNNPGALPPFRRNQFGATLGGPVVKNRTFFFAAYEGLRRVEGQSKTATVPTMLERTGDFSRDLRIFDPASTMADPADPTGKRLARSQFAGNIIPAQRLNPVAMAILNQFVPAPNLPGAANVSIAHY